MVEACAVPYVVSMRMLARGFACSGYVYSHAWRLLWAGVVVRIRVFGLQAYMDSASFCSGGLSDYLGKCAQICAPMIAGGMLESIIVILL